MPDRQLDHQIKRPTRRQTPKFLTLPRSRAVWALGAILMLFVMFQNFTSIPLDKLRPQFAAAHASSETDGTADIRNLAPYRAPASESPVVVTPSGGTDMNTIGQDWLTREAHLITGGADERLLVDLNKKIDRYFNPKIDPEENTSRSGGSAAVLLTPAQQNHTEDSLWSGMKVHSMRVMSVNRLQMNFNNRTELSCAMQGDGMQLNLSRPLNEVVDLSLHHETSSAKSTLSINYRW